MEDQVKNLWGWLGKEIVEFGFHWLVVAILWVALTVLGALLFGRGYKKRIAELERKITQQSPVTVSINQGEAFDAEEIARRLDAIYTRRQAEAIVRYWRNEIIRERNGDLLVPQSMGGANLSETRANWRASPGAGRLAAKLIVAASTLDEAREIWSAFHSALNRTDTKWAYWAFISRLKEAEHGDEIYDLAYELADNGEDIDPNEEIETALQRWKEKRDKR